MRYLSFTPALALALLFVQCGGADNARQNTNAANTSTTSAPASNVAPPTVASSHGGGAANTATTPGATGGAATPSDKAPVATPDMDAKIEQAESKAKAAGASAADKKAAAAARMARGNYYYEAGDPRLYRYALGDFRTALRHDPGNADAKQKIETIESIYRGMGRPIPTNGLEQ